MTDAMLQLLKIQNQALYNALSAQLTTSMGNDTAYYNALSGQISGVYGDTQAARANGRLKKLSRIIPINTAFDFIGTYGYTPEWLDISVIATPQANASGAVNVQIMTSYSWNNIWESTFVTTGLSGTVPYGYTLTYNPLPTMMYIQLAASNVVAGQMCIAWQVPWAY
jgi:hypothetical protein